MDTHILNILGEINAMTINRYAKVKELYKQSVMEDIFLKDASDKDDLDELEKELAGELPKIPQKKPIIPSEKALTTKKVPGKNPMEELEMELTSKLPTEEPSKTVTEPAVKEKEDPYYVVMPGTKKPEGPNLSFSFNPKQYTESKSLAKKCPVCNYENRPVTDPNLTACKKCKKLYNRMKKKVDYYGITPEQAIIATSKESKYNYSKEMLKTIYDSQGITPITVKHIEEVVSPSLGKTIEDIVDRLNSEKDEKTGELSLDKHGIPIPLKRSVVEETKWLAQALRLSPRAFQEKIDEYNSEKRGKDLVRPIPSTDIISDVPGKRYKETYLSIWNKEQIKKVFTDNGWVKELEKILQNEKIEKVKTGVQRIVDSIEDAKSKKETIEEELAIIDRESPDSKHLKLLNAFRKATPEQAVMLEKKYKVTRKMLEGRYGKEFGRLERLKEMKKRLLENISKNIATLEERYEKRRLQYFELLEEQGHKFNFDAEIEAKKNNAELSELEKELTKKDDNEDDSTPSEGDELEKELTSRLNTLHQLLRFSAPFKPEPHQMGLFGDEPEKEEDPREKLKRLLDPSETGNVGLLSQPPRLPEPEKLEPKFTPIHEKTEPIRLKPEKTITEPFGTIKGKYTVSFISTNPATKEKKALKGTFQYTPGARSKNVEEALKKTITNKYRALLVETHGIGPGSYVKVVVSDPETNTKAYSFSISKDGEMEWRGTGVEDRRIKELLLKNQPDIRNMLNMGLITLNDLEIVDNKLVEKKELELGYVPPPAHEAPKAMPDKPREPITKRIPKQKRIDDLRRKKDLGIIKEEEIDELNELEIIEKDMARIKELHIKENLTPEEETELADLETLHEDVKFKPRTMQFIEPAEHESKEFTRECPYKGCGAKISEDAKTCWKCKSPITKNEIRKVTKRKIKMTKERPVKDPITGKVTMEEYVTYPPIHSLVTITTDDSGKPLSARCEKLNVTYKPTGGFVEVPAFPEIMKEIKKSEEVKNLRKVLGDIEKNPKYTAEQKEIAKKRVAAKIKPIYEGMVAGERGEDSPWKTIKDTIPKAGLPTGACKSCPGEIEAPFEEACAEIKAVLKSLEGVFPSGYEVWDYEKVRNVKEEPKEPKSMNRYDPHWVSEKAPDANDGKYASRFNSIMKLYLMD